MPLYRSAELVDLDDRADRQQVGIGGGDARRTLTPDAVVVPLQ